MEMKRKRSKNVIKKLNRGEGKKKRMRKKLIYNTCGVNEGRANMHRREDVSMERKRKLEKL